MILAEVAAADTTMISLAVVASIVVPVIGALVSAIVFLYRAHVAALASNTKKSDDSTAAILDQRDKAAARVDQLGTHVSRMAEAIEANTTVVRELRDASIRQTAATEQVRDALLRLAEKRSSSSQETKAVRP